MAAGTVVLESHPALATAVFVAVGGAPPKSCAYPGGQLVRTATYPMMKVLRWSARGVDEALDAEPGMLPGAVTLAPPGQRHVMPASMASSLP